MYKEKPYTRWLFLYIHYSTNYKVRIEISRATSGNTLPFMSWHLVSSNKSHKG